LPGWGTSPGMRRPYLVGRLIVQVEMV